MTRIDAKGKYCLEELCPRQDSKATDPLSSMRELTKIRGNSMILDD
jgi:hypothetical protein